tara:strand:+ start:1888 stop:3234 length:1347 start_codon:yes stop_codon:yes gene_type:complete
MKKLSSNFAFTLFFSLLVFTRSFAGIYIFNYRIGEYLVAFGLILTIFLTLYFKLSFEFDKFTLNIFRAIFLAFLVTIFATNSDLLWTYTFRVTSYIWTASYVFVGYYLFKDIFTKTNSYILFFGVLIIYIFGTGNYPDILINLFKQMADKFTFVKASDMVLAIIITNLISLNVLKKRFSYIYFLITVASFLPLIVQMSRGSAVALFLFFLMYICFNFKFIFFNLKNVLLTVLAVPLIFTFSTYRITQFDLSEVPIEQLDQVLVDSFDDEVGKIKRLTRQGDEVDPFLSFYIEEREHVTGKHLKLISTDGTFNWRLDMWQELYYFQDDENKLFLGYGTTNKLPVFLLEYDEQNKFNIGHDKSNEQIHNYFVNIFGRGGFLQLILFIIFHISLYYFYYKKFSNHYILLLFIPSIFNSLTDISMEGVQFPINYYLTYGYLLASGIRMNQEI